MKKLLFFALAFLPCALVCSCSDDDKKSGGPDEEPEEVACDLKLATDTVFFAKTGGAQSIQISSSASADVVVASASADWLHCSVANNILSVEADKYNVGDNYEGFSLRKASVNIVHGDCEESLVVVQWPNDLLKPDLSDVFTKVVTMSRQDNVNYQGANYFVSFEANGDFVVESPWWMSVSCESAEGSPFAKKAIISIKPNYDTFRVGKVVFSQGDESFTCTFEQSATEYDFEGNGMLLSASEIASSMTYGVNFANLFDGKSVSSVSDAVYSAIADSSANVVRFPCAWYSHGASVVGRAPAVKQEVERALEHGMFVIINADDVESWGGSSFSVADTVALFNLFRDTWLGLAAEFAGYNDHVLFEAYGKLPLTNSTPSDEQIRISKRLNEIFVQTVRRSGGNNFRRSLVVPLYAQDPSLVSIFSLPKDDIDDRLVASCQFFAPSAFALESTYKYWGDMFDYDESYSKTKNVTASAEGEVATILGRLASVKAPVFVGAIGSIRHSNEKIEAIESSEAHYVYTVAKTAKDLKFVPVLHCDGEVGLSKFGVVDRTASPVRFLRPLYFRSFMLGAIGQEDVSVSND